MSSFRSSCEQVLRRNDRGAYTVPSPRLYPHQWAWDSAFAAVGWAHLEPDRAWTELETLMAGQWDDGRVPHVRFHDLSGDYFPGPAFWETERTSSITQPPVWATCARRIVEVCGDGSRAAALLEPFERSHLFFRAARDPLGRGTVAVVHPWESGLDNGPMWDGPLSRVDVSDPPAFERRDTAVVGDASMRPTDAEYLRYACLVKAIARDGFGPGPFAVYDPMITALLSRAERDLGWLAERCGRRALAERAQGRAEAMRRALVDHLYAPDLGRFIYEDARARERIACDVVGSYLPLVVELDESLAAGLVRGLAERFAASWPLPSTSPLDPAFDPRRYWRGPVWVNVNWLLADRVDGLARSTVELVRARGFHEYFHPETGEGLGGESFAWTAALALDLDLRAS